MNRVISSVEHITRSKECRVVFKETGRHIFGGTLENLEVRGPASFKKLHHVFTVDMGDDLSPIRFSDTRFLPLVFPLAYEDASTISYKLVDELEIEIVSSSVCRRHSETHFPGDLPARRAVLKPLSYAERRIAHSGIREMSFFDRLRWKRLWNGSYFRVSGILDYSKGFGPCLAKTSATAEECSAWCFAVFPATQVPLGKIWHSIPSDTILKYFLCIHCHQIHGHLSWT